MDSTVPVCVAVAVSSYARRRKLPFLVAAGNAVVAAVELQRIVSGIVSNHHDITVAVAVNAAAGNGVVVVDFVKSSCVVKGVLFQDVVLLLVVVLGCIRMMSIVVVVVTFLVVCRRLCQ